MMFGNQFDKLTAEIKAGHIPAKKYLTVKSDDGIPVAHVLVREIRMAANWAGWTIADSEGWTAAHAAANEGMLPPDFMQWDLRDDEGVTVKDVFNRIRDLKSDDFGPEEDDFPAQLEEHRPIEQPADRPKKGVEYWLSQAQDILSRPSRHPKVI